MTNSRRDIIKGAAMTTTGIVLGGMSSLKLQAATQQPVSQASERPQTSPSQLLAGKVALVTGAARGIGRAIAVDFAKNGADVALLDIADPTGGMAISATVLPMKANWMKLSLQYKHKEAKHSNLKWMFATIQR